MPTADKRNEYLDTNESENEDEPEYDSEVAENSKLARVARKRKISDVRSATLLDDQESASGGEVDELPTEPVRPLSKRRRVSPPPDSEKHDNDLGGNSDENTDAGADVDDDPEQANPTLPNSKRKKNKTGVIYLSRIPPFMKPSTVRHLLTPYGPITRLFLTPEPPTAHSARVRAGGNKKRSFVDGWVEFAHKRDAKLVAETLNANIIGGKKGGYYRDDVWNMRYLRGFKWADLTEQIKNENAERAARLRMEIARTTRENRRFVEGVERGKMLEKMRAGGKAAPETQKVSGGRRLEGDGGREGEEPSRGRKVREQQPSGNAKEVLDMIL